MNKVEQIYLKEKGLMIMISLFSAIIPLSIDLYLPVLPKMVEKLSTTQSLVNLTLTFFYIFFGISTLLLGPLSDKYGRKKILLIGTTLYTLSSFFCMMAINVESLILFRIIQAIGSGAIVAVASAIIKDSFDGKKRETMFAIVQSMMMIAPIIAPLLGAFLLKFFSWRGLFGVLGFIGIVLIVFTCLFKETLIIKSSESSFKSLGNLIVVLKNPVFRNLLIIFSFMALPLMAYVAVSPYIFVNIFGLSEQKYSYYFAFNSLFSVIGPILCLYLTSKISSNKIIVFSLVITFLCGICVITFGLKSPILLALIIAPSTLVNGILKPLGVNLMFEKSNAEAGTISSLINFTFILFGFVGMTLVSALSSINFVILLGIILSVVGLINFLLIFLAIKNTNQIKQNI
jgi:DHA1 family bicyclomycin/chloramphenicol resistance-like MFS transporter